MTKAPTDDLIARLSADAAPVRPLAPPLRRAAATMLSLAVVIGIAILTFSSGELVPPPGERGPAMLAAALIAMLATGALALVAAFHMAVPGRSRRWMSAPLIPFAAWLMLSGIGCYRNLARTGGAGLEAGHGMDCLVFILGASLLLGPLILWRLSRAAPVDPLPVALMAGLGTAALSAFLLQFFHPFSVTFVDLAIHLIAVLIVVGLTALLKRPMLRPA